MKNSDQGPVANVQSLSWRRFRFKSFWKGLLGKLMDKLHMPGAVQPFEMKDAISGRHIRVSVSAYYTKISVDGRDFFFHRYSGKFDGTGSMMVEEKRLWSVK